MSHVLSLIAAASKAPLNEAQIDAARRALHNSGAESDAPDWLAAGGACDAMAATYVAVVPVGAAPDAYGGAVVTATGVLTGVAVRDHCSLYC